MHRPVLLSSRYIIAASLVAAAVLTFVITSRMSAQQAQHAVETPPSTRSVKLMQVGIPSSRYQKSFPAKVVANQEVDLAFRINGQLTDLTLLAGQSVQQGDLLAQLDNRDAKNNLLNAEANHQLAKADFSRKKELLARKLISKAEFDTSEAQLHSTLATLNTAQDQLSYTQLIAPFSGVIAKVDLENYQMLQASQVVLTLQTNQKFDLTFNVPESYIFNNIDRNGLASNTGQSTYNVKFHGSDDTFAAEFKEMNTVVNSGSQTYQITLSFTPPTSLTILPGMSADVLVQEEGLLESAPLLPLTAIAHDHQTDQDFVWVYQPKTQTVVKSLVILGQIRKKGVEVLGGIETGDQVVAIGANSISSEIKVTPLRWERGI